MVYTIPKSVQDLIQAFSRLPGIGPKTASRLTMYLLQSSEGMSRDLSDALQNLKSSTSLCEICWHLTTQSPCSICSDVYRDSSIVCVVEEPGDLMALEKTGSFKGMYHVLHGVLSPLDEVGPKDLKINGLLERVQKAQTTTHPIVEIILATNPTLEGESTAHYLAKQLKPLGVKITRIARGLPSGGDIEYADDLTLQKALEGRREF